MRCRCVARLHSVRVTIARDAHAQCLRRCSRRNRWSGAFITLHTLPPSLPSWLLSLHMQVRGIFDSAMWLDLEPYSRSKLTPLMEQTRQVLQFHKAHGRLGNECASK